MTYTAQIDINRATPLPQRAQGAMRLVAKRRGAQSVIADLRQQGALKALFPRCSGDALDCVFLNTAGGLTGGDRMALDVVAGAGAHVVLSSQAAERGYAALDDQVAKVDVTLQVAQDARIDWLPQETILFNGSRLDRVTRIDLAPGAGCLMLETVVLGRAAMGETVTRLALNDRREIFQAGRPVMVEALRLTDAALLSGPAGLAGMRAFATLAMVGGGAGDLLDAVRAVLDEPGVAAAASAPEGRLMLRMMAQDGWPLRRQIVRALAVLRRGRPLPRVWQM